MLALGTGLSIGLGAQLPAGAATTGPAAVEPVTSTGLPIEVTITKVTPQVLAPGTDLSVTVTLRNAGPTPVEVPQVVVHLDQRSFISRSSLDRWRYAEPDDPAGQVVLRTDLAAPLAPGATTSTRVTVPASDVAGPARGTDWGARGLAVEVVDAAEEATGERLGLARTFALWFPDQEVTATRVSVLAPVVGGPVDPHTDTWVDDLEQLTGPEGRLAAVLDATADHPDVTWVLDPWLVDVAGSEHDPDADEPPESTLPSGASAGPQARAWAEALVQATVNRDVVLLPYGDTDLAAIAHAQAGPELTTALERSAAVAARTGLPGAARSAIVWPADALPDRDTAVTAAAAGARAIVVGPGEMLPPAVLTYTPTGRTTVPIAGGEVVALVADERLSAALDTGFVRGGTLGDPEVDPWGGALNPATAAQDLLAELAVITRERPADARHVLLTVPRDWDPDPAVASAQLAVLETAPWVLWEPVTALVGAPDTRIDRGTLPVSRVDPGEVSAQAIGTLTEAVDAREQLAQMFADPAAHLVGADAEALSALSVAWRADPAGRAALVEASVAATAAIRSGVHADPGSPLNLISTTGELPVRVTNALDDDVTIQVMPRPGDARLLVEDPVTLTVPARGEAVAMVPVHAIQSADLAVRVELSTPDGVLIDDSTVLTVRVRAEWEGIVTAVIGVLLAVGVVVGVVRTIRRGRAGSRAAPVDSGPDALSPEQAGSSAEEPGA